MSDTLTFRKYRRQPVTPVGTSPSRKFAFLFFALMIGAAAGTAYLVWNAGIVAEDNPRIAGQVLERINLERQAVRLGPVQPGDRMSNEATRISREVRTSPLAFMSGQNPSVKGRTNIIVVPRLACAIPGYDALQEVFTGTGSDETSFRHNALDPSVDSVGIGVIGDSNNYYIVTTWA